jgi:two-component system NtrC family sensor kinase
MTSELARAREEITAWSETLEHRIKEKANDLEQAHLQMVRVEKMASLGNLAATVAHELNNPLEGIFTFARLLIKKLKRSNLDTEERESCIRDLTLVADEAERSGNIVKNLLLFARQKTGSFQPSNLREIINRCNMLMQHHATIHQVELMTRCPDTLLVECDPQQVQQALVAVMVNAIEAMSGNSSKDDGGTLEIAVTDTESEVCIVAKDNGVGMSEEVKAHIFEPFFTTKSETKGVGLGLSTVYGIVELHRGRIEVKSAPGKGTTVVITLPLKQTERQGRPGVPTIQEATKAQE